MRKLDKPLELVPDSQALPALLRRSESEETVIDRYTEENDKPRFIAKRSCRLR